MTNYDAVEEYLKKHGSITSYDAFAHLGVTRLAAVIFDLKKRGLKIKSERVESINRYGNNSHYALYTLEK